MKLIFLLLTILTFQFQTLLAAQFIKGYYYDTNGRKIEGLIKFNRAKSYLVGGKPSNIQFKTNASSKAIKLTTDDISSFVIEKDSFTIVYNIKISSVSGKYAKDFAQVVKIGAINLFLHKSIISDGQRSYEHETYIISRGSKYLGIWDYNYQRIEIAEYFSERVDLRARIMDKKDETPLLALIEEFNKTTSR